MLTSDNPLNTYGKRLKYLRLLAKLGPDTLAESANIGRSTIFYWEKAQETPTSVTSRSINKVLEAIRKAGIECTEQWLLTGSGAFPRKIYEEEPADSANSAKQLLINSQPNIITLNQEIELFLSNPNTVITKIANACMLPIYASGDVVGGKWEPGINLEQETICIVEINGKLQVRKIKKTAANNFDLSYICYDTNAPELFEIKNYFIEKAAPVIRVWR